MSFVRYGSRFLTKKRSTVGYLARYGSRLKAETENGVFLPWFGKRFKKTENGTVLGYGAAVLVQIAEMVGPETVGYDTVRYGQGDKFGRTTV